MKQWAGVPSRRADPPGSVTAGISADNLNLRLASECSRVLGSAAGRSEGAI